MSHSSSDNVAPPERVGEEASTPVGRRDSKRGAEAAFYLGVVRGGLAIVVGGLLFFAPETSSTMLTNMMGFFWLVTGIALLRRNRNDPLVQHHMGRRTAHAISGFAIVAGLLVLTRSLTGRLMSEAMLLTLLGLVILATGLIHLLAEARGGGVFSASHRWLHAALGVLEVILGLVLIISPLDLSDFTYWVATTWALIFGVLSIVEAFVQRSANRSASEDAEAGTPA